ncbi:MAG: alpha-hydroxy acid oxidase, partial [Pseudomonadota bacterium]
MSVFDFFTRPVEQRFPSVAAMERVAVKRIPKFASDYMVGGIGREVGRDRNITQLDSVRFTPRYVVDYETPPDISSTIFGKWDAPFGPGPVGLTGLMWPRAQIHIARAAAEHNVPIGLSTYGTETIEDAGAIAGKNLWFQLYPIHDEDIERDLMKRFEAVGGEVMIVTVDIPQSTRRERDLGNGLAVPPRQDYITYWQAATHPAWAIETLRHGMPKFKTVLRYVPPDTPAQSSMQILGSLSAGHVGPERLRRYRDEWKGKLIVKGVLHQDDVKMCLDTGVDGIVVSNHGGRQLDGAITAPEVLPQIRQYAGG